LQNTGGCREKPVRKERYSNENSYYPGVFDPFTDGHLDMVRKSAALFDMVYVAIGVNSAKTRRYDSTLMKEAIERSLDAEQLMNCEVCVYEGLMAEFMRAFTFVLLWLSGRYSLF